MKPSLLISGRWQPIFIAASNFTTPPEYFRYTPPSSSNKHLQFLYTSNSHQPEDRQDVDDSR